MSEDTPDLTVALAEAQRLLEAGELGGAFNAFQGVLSDDPDNAVALNIMAQMLAHNGQFDEAIAIYRRAVDAHPDNLQPRADLCRLLFRHGQGQDSLAHIDKLVELDGDNPEWYSIATYLYHALGRLDRVHHYLELGNKNASRGIDYQAAVRHQAPPALKVAIDEKKRATLTGRLGDVESGEAALVQWAAEVPPADAGTTDVRLRGATVGLADGWRVRFSLTPADAGDDGDSGGTVTLDATPDKTNDPVRVLSAVADGLAPGRTYRCRMTAIRGNTPGGDVDETLDGGEQQITIPVPAPPEVETGGAGPIGTEGVVLYGAVGGTNLPTRTRFVWGTDADRLDRETPVRPLPPGRTLKLREAPVDTLPQWMVYALYNDLTAIDGSADRYTNPYFRLRLKAPYGKDRNHLSGVGVAELVAGWESTAEPADGVSGAYPGGSLDLRDAQVTLTLGGENLDTKDYLFAFWIQSYIGRKMSDVADEGSSPWALTGQLVDPGRFGDAANYIFTLTSAPDAWTFAGNNPLEQAHSSRYRYHPLNDVLANHRGNFVMILLFGHERELPEGAIDVHMASLRCRNGSLLAPGTGAALVHWPADSLSDPAALTSGWIGEPDHFWISGRGPTAPQEFVWDLGSNVELQSLRARQNPLYPARDIEVSAAAEEDGEFVPIWQTALAASAKEGNVVQASAFTVLDQPVDARLLKLRILSGHRDDRWGLDAIEAFGAGPPPRPETEPCTLSEDIDGLAPGATIYYRLAAENAAGEMLGEIRQMTVPDSEAPRIIGAEIFRHRPGRTTVLVRMNAMGQPTTLSAGGEDDAGRALSVAARDAGHERTDRHITLDVEVTPGSTCTLAIAAVSDAGAAEPVTVEWHAPE